jgi:hypothetical protein
MSLDVCWCGIYTYGNPGSGCQDCGLCWDHCECDRGDVDDAPDPDGAEDPDDGADDGAGEQPSTWAMSAPVRTA